ncbi:hypothetical protein CTAYLR_004138 [Chrysophaeum taylorii]|uniref:PDZ domain-containing protein n=1 Tax=Chrysophaeum taylorii TaxID=2483200 RepID=A0AAD7UMP5_9STRA|nr:hypothetical protein CTAYLR_004138 [Chrysophaeum taylorii]
MGFLDDIKRRAEAFSKEVQKSTSASTKRGNVLGTGETLAARFVGAGPLGIVVGKGSRGEAVVTSVEGAAAKAGVESGDTIVRVDGTRVATYEEFLSIDASKRPIELGLSRPALMAKQHQRLTTDEREARREAQARAALERDGAWAKRIQSSKSQPKPAAERPEHKKSTNPETIAAWKRAEERADRTVKELGYDPFKPLSTGSNASSRPKPNADDAVPQRRDDEAIRYDEASSAADVVVRELASHPDKAQVSTCVATIIKLLENAETKDDPKFKRVRLANASIQAKILGVPGGLEALIAAGFDLEVDEANDGETILRLATDFDRPKLRALADALHAFKPQLL